MANLDPSRGPGDSAPAIDSSLKFVRVIRVRDDGFVEFDFAIGDPELSVELILPAAAFADFCATNAVTLLGEISQPDDVWSWGMRQAAQGLQKR